MLSKHDELLVRDLRLQPLWLLWLYIVLGLLAVTLGLLQDSGVAKAACVGGGFLVALLRHEVAGLYY